MTRETNQQAERVARLSALLDERRDELESVAGVVGAGIGFAAEGEPEQVVIQVFVGSPSLVDEVQQQVAGLVGEGTPVETVFMPTPAADGGQHKGGK